jgi:predicted PurR-regulated permease PerM
VTLFLLWKIFAPFLAPIAWAAVLAILLAPAHRRLRGRIRHPDAAALLATGGTVAVVVLPAVFVALALVEQAARLYAFASSFFSTRGVGQLSDLMRIPLLEGWIRRITAWMPVTQADVERWILATLKSAGSWLAGFVPAAALGFLGFLVSFAIMVFTLFFFFRDGASIWGGVVRAVPLARERTAALVARLDSVLHAVLVGTLLTAFVQGALGGVGFAIFGLPSPVVFGAMMFVLALLPVGGTALVWLPAAVVLAAQGSWGRGIGLLLWGALIVGLFDNWFKPLLISGRSRMNTLPVFFGVTGGLAAFGFIGVVVGPLVVALGLTLWETIASGEEESAEA